MSTQPPRPPVPVLAICRRHRWAVVLATLLVEALIVIGIGADPALPAFLVFGAGGVVLAAVDLETRRLPDRLVLACFGAGAVLLGAAALAGDGATLLRAVLGSAALFGCYLALALLNPSGLGLGDVKLAGVVGLYLGWLGWNVLLTGALAGFLLVGLVALVLLVTRRVGRSTELPFGPFMLAGALLAVLVGGQIPV